MTVSHSAIDMPWRKEKRIRLRERKLRTNSRKGESDENVGDEHLPTILLAVGQQPSLESSSRNATRGSRFVRGETVSLVIGQGARTGYRGQEGV